jgi:hypothetical protein
MASGKGLNTRPMKNETLMPLGKLKGEMNGEFEAFYLAMDAGGQLYINRDLGYRRTAYEKSNGWELITRSQLANYEKQLHFIAARKHQMKM